MMWGTYQKMATQFIFIAELICVSSYVWRISSDQCWHTDFFFNFTLHLWTFKTPTSSAVMNDKGVADWAFEMPNGVMVASYKELGWTA
jgi:hypothetical protein